MPIFKQVDAQYSFTEDRLLKSLHNKDWEENEYTLKSPKIHENKEKFHWSRWQPAKES